MTSGVTDGGTSIPFVGLANASVAVCYAESFGAAILFRVLVLPMGFA